MAWCVTVVICYIYVSVIYILIILVLEYVFNVASSSCILKAVMNILN